MIIHYSGKPALDRARLKKAQEVLDYAGLMKAQEAKLNNNTGAGDEVARLKNRVSELEQTLARYQTGSRDTGEVSRLQNRVSELETTVARYKAGIKYSCFLIVIYCAFFRSK